VSPSSVLPDEVQTQRLQRSPQLWSRAPEKNPDRPIEASFPRFFSRSNPLYQPCRIGFPQATIRRPHAPKSSSRFSQDTVSTHPRMFARRADGAVGSSLDYLISQRVGPRTKLCKTRKLFCSGLIISPPWILETPEKSISRPKPSSRASRSMSRFQQSPSHVVTPSYERQTHLSALLGQL